MRKALDWAVIVIAPLAIVLSMVNRGWREAMPYVVGFALAQALCSRGIWRGDER